MNGLRGSKIQLLSERGDALIMALISMGILGVMMYFLSDLLTYTNRNVAATTVKANATTSLNVLTQIGANKDLCSCNFNGHQFKTLPGYTVPEIISLYSTAGCVAGPVLLADGQPLPGMPNTMTHLQFENFFLLDENATAGRWAATLRLTVIDNVNSGLSTTRTSTIFLATDGSASPGVRTITGCTGSESSVRSSPVRMNFLNFDTIQVVSMATPPTTSSLFINLNDGTQLKSAAAPPLAWTWTSTIACDNTDAAVCDQPNTWYYFYAVENAAAPGEFRILASANSPITMAAGVFGPAGFNNRFLYLGAVFNDAGQNLTRFYQVKDQFFYRDPVNIINSAANVDVVTVHVNANLMFPVTARSGTLRLSMTRDNTFGLPSISNLFTQSVGEEGLLPNPFLVTNSANAPHQTSEIQGVEVYFPTPGIRRFRYQVISGNAVVNHRVDATSYHDPYVPQF